MNHFFSLSFNGNNFKVHFYEKYSWAVYWAMLNKKYYFRSHFIKLLYDESIYSKKKSSHHYYHFSDCQSKSDVIK